MKLSGRVVLLGVAALVAAFTAISVRNRLSQVPAVEAPPAVARIVVTKHDLALGSFVQGAQDLEWGPAPDNASQGAPQNPGDASVPSPPKESYLYEGAVKLSDFNGAVVRRSVHAHDPVTASALMKSGEGGFMSAVLGAGMRAVSLAVTATSGNAGFVSPGDRVDLIVTHRVKTATDDSVVSETFLHDVRVVAVDQMLDNPENKAILAKTITVEVTPRQAEQVAVAAEMGKISIALRSLAAAPEPKPAVKNLTKVPGDPTASAMVDLYGAESPDDLPPPEPGYTRDSDLSLLLGHKSTAAPRVLVIRGDKTENMDFYQEKQ